MKIYQSTIFVTSGLLMGLIVGQTSIFAIIYLFVFMGLASFIFIVARITGNSKLTSFMGLVSLSLIISVAIAWFTVQIIADNRLKYANTIIAKIEIYKEKNNQYPTSLLELQEIDHDIVDEINYSIDTTRQEYVLSFPVDSWHLKLWSRMDKKWIMVD
jgi:hypothetical protein